VNELYAHTVALTFTVFPAAIELPSLVCTTSRSFDSSEWYVPDVPSAHALLMVFGWFGSEPPASVSRPSTSDGPESHPDATLTHFGAFNVLSYTAVCNPTDEFTVSETVVLCVSAPEVPVTVTVAVPTVAPEEAVNVSVDVALPFAGGVTGFVENVAVTPLGSPEALSVVAELKPLRLVTVIVLVPVPPCVTVTELGEAPIEKSGVLVVPQVGNLKFPIRVFQLKLPVVFMYSSVNQKVQSSTGSTCIAL
jgi:hypothetical protein